MSRFLLLLGSVSCLWAQDTRNVTEPTIPPICITLTAQLNANVPEADETELDTARIQKAMDGCTNGKAVELRADSGHNTFLSAPLELRAGVTLLIAANTTLLASRNPRDYD